MDVAVDMVLAEAMIPRTLGTVAEFQFRMLRIGPAADSTPMDIEFPFLFFPDALRLTAEIHCIHTAFPSGEESPDPLSQVRSAEDRKIQDGDQRKKIERKAGRDDPDDEKHRINQRQPLDPDWQDKEKEHLHIREKRSKREKHGKIDIICADRITHPGQEINEESVKHCEKHAAEEINREAACPPLGFQNIPHHIIKVESDESQEIRAYWDEDKRDEPPYLSAQNVIGRKRKVIQDPRHDELQDPNHPAGNDDVAHQVPDPEVRMSVTE